MSRRIIAQRILTGEFLSWDVPLLNATSTREVSGPGGINGELEPATRRMLGPDGRPLLAEWQTALYYEADGQIRHGGIVTRMAEDEHGRLRLEAPGFSTYPTGIVYLGDYQPGLGADPMDVIRHLWAHVQSYSQGDLGVTLDATLSGTSLDDVRYNPDTGAEEERTPYRLGWWDNRDCGQEISTMLNTAPADYLEHHTWNGDHTAISHHIEFGVPSLGRRRTDLRFAEGENILVPVPLEIEGDEFAQTVIGLGKGQGRDMARHVIEGQDDRLRRTAVVSHKQASQVEIAALAQAEYQRLSTTEGFERIVIRDHRNAPLAAINPGDEIFVDADLEWFGRTRLWSRVARISEPMSGSEIATLDLMATEQEA